LRERFFAQPRGVIGEFDEVTLPLLRDVKGKAVLARGAIFSRAKTSTGYNAARKNAVEWGW
jgi:hypothetical protein